MELVLARELCREECPHETERVYGNNRMSVPRGDVVLTVGNRCRS